MIDIEKCRAILNKAAPEPWIIVEEWEDEYAEDKKIRRINSFEDTSHEAAICEVGDWNHDGDADAAFIVAARSGWGEALDEVERLRATVPRVVNVGMTRVADMDEYQTQALSHAFYPNKGSNLPYAVLGLCGETGELAEKLKKCIRDNGGVVTPEIRLAMLKECSDVYWYLAAVTAELGHVLSDVASCNLEKLSGRATRGTLGGSGDDR